MIEISRAVFPSQEQLREAALGIRHSYNSEKYSDTPGIEIPQRSFGQADYILAKKLTSAGERRSHCKFLRMLSVIVTINAPLYFWKEADTYKIGTVRNSASTMHKIADHEFTLDDFSHEHLDKQATISLEETISVLNYYRDLYLKEEDKKQKKVWWWQMIQLLPSSFNQLSTVSCNYEVLHAIYLDRHDHRLDEWRDFCVWIEEAVPMSDLIIPQKSITVESPYSNGGNPEP